MTGSAPLTEERPSEAGRDRRGAALVEALGGRPIVLVGLMGCGKTSTGRCLARRLGLEFVDTDTEIEWAANMSISEIFEKHGEAYFRDGERRVVARLLAEGPRVIATGGGAYLNEQTRARIAEGGLSVWLKADLDVLWRRVRRRGHRPLLKTADPEATLRELMAQRYPVYGRADVTVISRDGPHEAVVEDAIAAIEFHLRFSTAVPESSVPESSVPESSVPESSVPESSVPESSVPESSVPESSVPESSVPESSVPESSVPQSSVPQSSVPQSSVPEAKMTAEPPHASRLAPVVPQPSSAAARRVSVDLPGRAYDILIGASLLEHAGAAIARLAPGAGCAIVTDDNVAAHHLPTLRASLDQEGIRHASIAVRPGEGAKSWPVFAEVCDAILAARLERGDVVVALGGGVVGDLAGFAAASVRRGMRLVQVPTSLLAQVDSSVGGKTGINSTHGKNLVGAFHQPALVLADTDTLKTLPPREFAAGYAEVVKYGLIGDAPFFDWLDAHRAEIFAGGAARDEAVERSCQAKAGVVTRDERESGERALLNLGHTFGHAFERLTGYDGARLVHGEGVAIGMACAFRFSQRLGLCPADDVVRVEAHLRAAGLPIHAGTIPGFDAAPSDVLDAMRQDKKVERGALTFILARGIGRAFVAKGIAAADVLAFLEDDLKASA